MQELDNESGRRQLLPFDEITYEQNPRPRYNQGIGGFVRAIQHERHDYRINQQKRLYNFSRLCDPSFEFPQENKRWLDALLLRWDVSYPVLRPESIFMVVWNLFQVLSILFNFFEIPIALFLTERVYQFQMNVLLAIMKSAVPLAFNIIILIGLMIDNLVIRFNLAYYKEGKLISSRIQIFSRYMKFMFWIDLLGWMVLFIYIVSNDANLVYLKFVFYIKIISFLKLDQEILDWFRTRPVRYALYRLLRTIFVMWFFTTWVSSIYFAIDYNYYKEKGYYFQSGQLWLTNSNTVQGLNMITSFPWYVWYQYAVYWSLQTSSTVGYGNITPRNPEEVLYCNFVIVINTLLFAYYMNTIWEVITELTESSERYSQNWGNLKTMFTNEQMPASLKKKIGEFLQEIWIQQDQDIVEEELTGMLSEDLRADLYLSVRGQFFKKNLFFQKLGLFHEDRDYLTKQLVYLLEEENVGESEFIYSLGSQNPSLYYVLRGKVQQEISELNLFRDVCIHETFGFQEFMSQQQRYCSARAMTFCKFWKITRENFKATMRKNLSIYQEMIELKQNIWFEGKIELSGVKCLKCNNFSHFIRNCPRVNDWRKQYRKIFYYANRKVSREGFNFRKKFERRSLKENSVKIRDICYKKTLDCDKVTNTINYRKSANLFETKQLF